MLFGSLRVTSPLAFGTRFTEKAAQQPPAECGFIS
jgi:hypothetical protein